MVSPEREAFWLLTGTQGVPVMSPGEAWLLAKTFGFGDVARNRKFLVDSRELCSRDRGRSEMNELLYTTLEPTTTTVLAHSFLTEFAEKHDGTDAVVLVDDSHSVQDACHRHGFDFRDEQHENRNSVERVFSEVKQKTSSFSNCFSNAHTETENERLRSFTFT